MRSPFSGMDPYLESHWRDVHTSLMTYLRDQIQDQLPLDLVARVEESVCVDFADESRLIAPDVHITEDFAAEGQATSTAESFAVAEPLVVLEEVPNTARHVRIIDLSSGEQVITVIEVLSPTNKLTAARRDDYRRKQREYLLGNINLVEIDLLRCGEHVLSAAWELIPPKRRTYMMSVRSRTRTTVFGASLREPLPVIPIPLRTQDHEIRSKLQELITQVYDRGRYWKLNYQVEPVPQLPPDDVAWVDSLLRASAHRN